MQATATKDLRFIEFSSGMLDKALEANSAFQGVEIPADVYGTGKAGTVIGVNNMLVVPSDADADVVYAITAAIFDHLDQFKAENANAAQIDPADSLELAIPLHPGASRYFSR